MPLGPNEGFLLQYLELPQATIDRPPYCRSGVPIIHPCTQDSSPGSVDQSETLWTDTLIGCDSDTYDTDVH